MSVDSVTYWLGIIKELPVLTREEERMLLYKAQEGDLVARNRIIECNLRLVVHIAKRYRSKFYKVKFEDLISAGNMGLFKSVKKFDLDKGLKFSTYAAWWIKQSIQRSSINNQGTIRLPVHIYEASSRYKSINMDQGINTEEWSNEDWCKALSQDSVTIREKQFKCIVKYEEAKFSSIFNKSDQEDGADSIDMSLEMSVNNEDLEVFSFEDILDCLNEEDRFIVSSLFGVDGLARKTVSEVAKELNKTCAYVKEKKEHCLSKLKHLLTSEGLGREALGKEVKEDFSQNVFF